mgnify:CR=1 FL=1
MGIGKGSLLPWILEGDGFVKHVLERDLHRVPDFIEQRGLDIERRIDRGYLEHLNEVYSEFFLYYDDAPLLIVNASEIDLANSAEDYQDLVDYLLDIRSGRHYFNPTFFR